MQPGNRVGIAVSGGADSVALLRILLELRGELGVVLSVVHINHQLRGAESDADAEFVAMLAQRAGLELFTRAADVRGRAAQNSLSLEASGRELRYEIFREVASHQKLNRIATAHTLDDQAETVLLKLLRGAWTRGLAGVFPQQELGEAKVVRPLLNESRSQVRAYLESIAQPWREDLSNQDRNFSRNRIRHELLPLLQREFNSGVAEVLSGVAEIARGEQDYWDENISRLWTELAQNGAPGNAAIKFNSGKFRSLSVAEQRRVATYGVQLLAGPSLDFKHIEAVRLVMSNGGNVALPGGMDLTVGQGELAIGRRPANKAQS